MSTNQWTREVVPTTDDVIRLSEAFMDAQASRRSARESREAAARLREVAARYLAKADELDTHANVRDAEVDADHRVIQGRFMALLRLRHPDAPLAITADPDRVA